MAQVLALKTVVPSGQMLTAFEQGYKNVVGRNPPEKSSYAIPCAQSALETGHWGSMYNFNAGNVTHSSDSFDFYQISGNVLKFRSYASVQDGVDDMFRILKNDGVISFADSGDVAGYVEQLAVKCYVGCRGPNYDPYPAYLTAMQKLTQEFLNTTPTPVVQPPLGTLESEAKTGEVLQGLLIGGALVGAGAIAWHAYKTSKQGSKSHRAQFFPGLIRSNPLRNPLKPKTALVLGGGVAALGVAGAVYLLSKSSSDQTSPNPSPEPKPNPNPQPLNPNVGMKYFPILDANNANIHFSDDFGIMHNGHPHAGNDIFASFGSLVLAPEDGKVTFTDDGIPGGAGCPPPLSFHFKGNSGTTYWATHFSEFIGGGLNDTITVEAGVEIAKVGNGGNACHTASHCHFEIHDPDTNAPIDPYPYLVDAVRLTQPIGIAAVPPRLLRA